MTTEIVLIIVVGLLIGSFLNVVIYRLPAWEAVLKTRSHCLSCQRQLKWYDLVPLFSFVILAGKCRYCGKPIAFQYPLVEALTALILLALYLYFGLEFAFFALALLSCCLLVIFFYDLNKSLIPDDVVYVAIFLAVLAAIGLKYQILDILLGLALGAGGLGILVLISREKWMGYGDVKLGAVLGLGLGYPQILVALFFAFILGSLVGGVLVATGKKTLKDSIPFGPFLISGFYLALFFGDKILGWYWVGW